MIFSSIKHALLLNRFHVVSATTTHVMMTYLLMNQAQSTPPGLMRSTILPEFVTSVALQDMPMNKLPHALNSFNLQDLDGSFKLHLKLHLSFLNSISFLESTLSSCSQYPFWVIFGRFRHSFPVLTLDLMARPKIKYMWTLYCKCHDWDWLTMHRH